MKIILSPSKTQDHSVHIDAPMTEPQFAGKAVALNKKLKRMSQKAIKEMMNIDGDLFEATYNSIKNFDDNKSNHAIATYSGLVFKYFDLTHYGPEEINYLNDHLVILSAHYGILRPYDGIKPYRLDMKMKPAGQNLYQYWQKDVDGYFENEVILDLASNEFSKMVQGNKITVGFRDWKEGQYKNPATYAKIARGMLLHQMVLTKSKDAQALKSLTFGGYTYNEEISRHNTLLFSRSL